MKAGGKERQGADTLDLQEGQSLYRDFFSQKNRSGKITCIHAYIHTLVLCVLSNGQMTICNIQHAKKGLLYEVIIEVLVYVSKIMFLYALNILLWIV